MSELKKYLGGNNEVFFTLNNVMERYYYSLERAIGGTEVTYRCYDGDKMFYSLTIRHIDDTYAWFFVRNEERIIERLYNKAHTMAQMAITSANKNG